MLLTQAPALCFYCLLLSGALLPAYQTKRRRDLFKVVFASSDVRFSFFFAATVDGRSNDGSLLHITYLFDGTKGEVSEARVRPIAKPGVHYLDMSSLSVGKTLQAKYSLDGRWYAAEVRQVTGSSSFFFFLFVLRMCLMCMRVCYVLKRALCVKEHV